MSSNLPVSTEEVVEARQPDRRPWRKRRLEAIAMAIMALGAMMMFQPFAIALYSYSFVVILVGTLMFIVVSHLND